MKKTISLLLLALAVSACTAATEMPSNSGKGTDLMLPSPCVCKQLDYDGRGYQWLG
ncbi:MAG: hypothetical protein JKY17_08615 [Magnetovibrio sp.]|nr:hypothetical protein [Magnetovibrio sp.]